MVGQITWCSPTTHLTSLTNLTADLITTLTPAVGHKKTGLWEEKEALFTQTSVSAPSQGGRKSPD